MYRNTGLLRATVLEGEFAWPWTLLFINIYIMNEEKDKITLTIEVSPECARFIQNQSEFQGVSEGRIVEELVRAFVG